MSDFLARLTERHADGATSAIVPRAVSRFESPTLPVDREIVEPSSPARPNSLTSRDVSVPGPAQVHESTSQAKEPKLERPARDAAQELKPVERLESTTVRIEQILKQFESVASSPAISTEPRRDTPRETEIIGTPIGPRIVASVEPRQFAPERVPSGHALADESEPTVIRVHIGRIDVHATTPTPEQPRLHRRAPDAAKPMSLDRYLSGKDRA